MVDLPGAGRPGGEIEIAAHHWHRPNFTEAQQMSHLGQNQK
jgi:hypothetical protein